MVSDRFGFSEFANNPFYRQQNARLIDMVNIGSGQRIVDLACGTGGVTKLITERLRGARNSVVIGIDHSSIALRQAMEELKDVRDLAIELVQSGVEQVSESVKEAVDTIFFCNAIHYVPDKGILLAEISNLLKPGGKLAFNTTFFEGAHLPETASYYRKWMLKAMRALRREYGLSPIRSDRVEARKQLTVDEYSGLLEKNGYRICIQEIDTVDFSKEGFLDISTFQDFIEGTMPGVPLEEASASLQMGVKEAFDEMKIDSVPRNWLDIVAVRT